MQWVYVFTRGWGLGFSIYLVVQIVAILTVRKKVPRLLILLPAPAMIIVGVLSVEAYLKNANLWPILMIFAGPFAAVLMALLWPLGLLMDRQGDREPK